MKVNNKKRITVSVITLLLVIFTIGITYAFVSQVLTGSKEVVINAGVLDLVLEEENAITISDALPMHDAVGMIQEDVFVFRLVNKTSNPTNYILKLSKIEADNELSPSDVKYYLTKEGVGEPKLLSSLPTDGTVDSGTIAGSDTIDYTLRLWINSAVTDEAAISGKTLNYKIDAEASQEIAKLSFADQLENIAQDSTSTFPNLRSPSSETNGRGIYKYQEDGVEIYYWRGNVSEVEGADNHVLFAGFCWEMVRTTSTGGVKIIYDGTPIEVDGVKTCQNSGRASLLTNYSVFNSSAVSPAYVGYMYGNTVYEYKTKPETDTSLTTAGILYGYDVEWTGTEYELKTKEEGSLFLSTGSWSTDRTSVANRNHYTCFDSDGKCEIVSYIYYTGDSSTPYYIDLSRGVTIEEALEQMYSNEQPSTIKTNIETWFESTDLDEEENLSKLEDVVYCNDRSAIEINGWSKDGDASKNMKYSSITRTENGRPDLSCSNRVDNRDRFTYKDTTNGNGLLKWPVGLLTTEEMALAGTSLAAASWDSYLTVGENYWTLSPGDFNNDNARVTDVYLSGALYNGDVNDWFWIRPVVSLAAGTTFVDGTTGTVNNPYVVQ